MGTREDMLNGARPGADDEEDAPTSSESDDPDESAKRSAGADLRAALQGDDDCDVFDALEHFMNVRERLRSGGDGDEPKPKKSDLVIAIGKAKPTAKG